MLQPQSISLRCLFCQASVWETELDSHIRGEHRIGHDRAVEMLIGLQYSEVTSTDQPQLGAGESPPTFFPLNPVFGSKHVLYGASQNELVQCSDSLYGRNL